MSDKWAQVGRTLESAAALASSAPDTSIRDLSRRGYDVRDNVLYAPVRSTGAEVALWPADGLVGFLSPDEPNRPAIVQRRAALNPSYAEAFARFLRLAVSNGEEMAYMMPGLKNALSEGSDGSGGFVVPADVAAEILYRRSTGTIVRRRARVIPTNRDVLTIPAFAPHASEGSVWNSGFTGTWWGETPTFSETDPAIQLLHIPIRKLRVGTKLSADLVEDAPSLLSWLGSAGGDNLATAEEKAFLVGSGAAGEPEGIMTALTSSQDVDVEGSTSNTISNTTAAAGSAPKLLTLAGSLPSQYQGNAVLIADAATEVSVNKLVDAQGHYQFPRVRSGGGRELLGYPAMNSPFVPLEGTNANRVILLGDIGAGYVIADRGMVTLELRERFADSGQVGIVLVDRVGGALYNPDAFRAGIV